MLSGVVGTHQVRVVDVPGLSRARRLPEPFPVGLAFSIVVAQLVTVDGLGGVRLAEGFVGVQGRLARKPHVLVLDIELLRVHPDPVVVGGPASFAC